MCSINSFNSNQKLSNTGLLQMNHRVLIHYCGRTWKRICFYDSPNDRALAGVYATYVQCVCGCHDCANIIFKMATGQQKAFCALEFSKLWISHNRSESILAGIQMQTTNPTKHSALLLTVSQRWISPCGRDDKTLFSWPPRLPDLSPCSFFVWGYVKDCVYVPPLPTT